MTYVKCFEHQRCCINACNNNVVMIVLVLWFPLSCLYIVFFFSICHYRIMVATWALTSFFREKRIRIQSSHAALLFPQWQTSNCMVNNTLPIRHLNRDNGIARVPWFHLGKGRTKEPENLSFSFGPFSPQDGKDWLEHADDGWCLWNSEWASGS